MDGKLLFFKNFLRHPKQVGSVIPSSKFLIDELMKNIDFENARYIAEYGSGTGCITNELLKRARKDTMILSFEINRKFCRYLNRTISDKRVIVINDSAENIGKHMKKLNIPRIDCIISGLPFSTLPEYKKNKIIEKTKAKLANEGKFVIYQFVNSLRKRLSYHFPRTSTKWVPFNIPPCFVYICQK